MKRPQALLELDVRDQLRRGEEPFAAIMQAVADLEPGQALRLIAPFRPLPLLGVMQERGYAHRMRAIGGTDWEVVFTPMPADCGPTTTD